MIFRQFFDRESCTYTYLLGDPLTREALLIDPVIAQVDRDLQFVKDLGLTLKYAIDTHVHADHITGTGTLRERTGCQIAISQAGKVQNADIQLQNNDRLTIGEHVIEARATPGHTSSCTSFWVKELNAIFTGDALFIRGCGRTDFQEGDAITLYRSVYEKIFSLPDDTLIYPGHDYCGRTVSMVAEEKEHNPRLGERLTDKDFAQIMNNLNLPYPKNIDVALPANLHAGVTKESPK